MDGGLNEILANDLAELLDMIRQEDLGQPDQHFKDWLRNRGYKTLKDAIATICNTLPKGSTICLK